MKVLTAPGVTWNETDLSLYSTGYGPTTAYIMGFTEKGEAYKPMTFTSRTAWTNYYGYPRTEAERYAYAAVTECLDQGGRLVFARLPYDNPSYKRVAAFKYSVVSKNNKISCIVGEDGVVDQVKSTPFYEIKAADPTVEDVAVINPADRPSLIDLDLVDAYRTGESKPPADTFVIADVSFNQYGKISEDKRKNEKCELVGIMPVVTTAANAMLAQSLIDVEPQNVVGYEAVGMIRTIDAAALSSEDPSLSGLQSNMVKDDDTAQLLNTKGWYKFVATQDIRVTDTFRVTDSSNDAKVKEELGLEIEKAHGVLSTWNGEYQVVDDEHVSISFKKVFRSKDFQNQATE